MKAPRKKMTKENWTGLAFVAPAFVLLAIFLFVPFFMTVGYSSASGMPGTWPGFNDQP